MEIRNSKFKKALADNGITAISLEHEIVEGDSVVKSWSFYEGGKEATL